MHKNRLIELTEVSGRSDRIGSKLREPLLVEQTPSEYLELDQKIKRINAINEEIGDMWADYKKTANPAKQKQITHQATLISQKNAKLMHEIDTEVRAINEELKKDASKGDISKALKVRQITQRARKSIGEFKEIQEKFTTGVKDTIRRQAIIIQGDITEEEVDEILVNPEKGQQMLESKLLNGPSVELENAVSDIIDKYRDIISLEKSMSECLEMMQEMALLVAIQGEQLDNIESTIDQTGSYMTNAEEKLVQAKGHHKSAKKKMCCIIMLLLGVIGAVLIPVLLTKL